MQDGGSRHHLRNGHCLFSDVIVVFKIKVITFDWTWWRLVKWWENDKKSRPFYGGSCHLEFLKVFPNVRPITVFHRAVGEHCRVFEIQHVDGRHLQVGHCTVSEMKHTLCVFNSWQLHQTFWRVVKEVRRIGISFSKSKMAVSTILDFITTSFRLYT